MRDYAIYACSVTICILVCFAVPAFTYKLDSPPFMVLVIALSNDETIMTLSVDHVLPLLTPDAWDLMEIFAYAIALWALSYCFNVSMIFVSDFLSIT